MSEITLTTERARLLYYGLGTPSQLVIHALGERGGSKQITDGVERIYADGLTDLRAEHRYATVAEDGQTYTLTDEGWSLFYAGTGWSPDFYGPGLVHGRSV